VLLLSFEEVGGRTRCKLTRSHCSIKKYPDEFRKLKASVSKKPTASDQVATTIKETG
jgi:hypothetical protein